MRDDPILIASPPRSGSSLTAGLLHWAGLFGGSMKVGDRWNKKGYFENLRVRDILIRYLRANDKDKEGKRYQPRNLDAKWFRFGHEVTQAMHDEGAGKRRWYFKDPKILVCRNLWLEHFPSARWVLVTRNHRDTIDSLMRTEFMDAYSTREEWAAFLGRYDYWMAEVRRIARNKTFTFNIDRIFQGEIEAAQELFD